ncbi:endonuclease-8 [Friedmanniella endophytica]|uniref:DNA-(apurinic or apyrimidinic site) lyase n=1 Tax=Microlunatus kandeliicorticis TaxID=1759536 RepID=A0A7W3P531_9ACTN|nr:Fpg/Nei family DNA glycosylase [Microlunatus kandeliicorticis]MBA8793455.1 endonuclease-8 [Microlunatus kandeliicorticis]
MPEGDTVWLSCRRLHAALAGQVLTRCELRVPQLAEVDLTGTAVREVVSRGKHQLIRFADGTTLHTHFRMEGSWRIYPHGRRWSGGPGHQIRAVLGTSTLDAVGWRLPVVERLPTAAEDEVVGHLGPDLLGPDWDLAEAVRRIRVHPERSVGEALLDQRNLAGIGTLYRAEVLFLQGIHPRTPVEAVPDLERICVRARQLLSANRTRWEQSTTGDLRPGRQHWVFERPGQPCRRCRTPIRTEEFGPLGQERRSYWCPHCQPATSP